MVSTAVSVFSIATSFTTDAQGIADNTVTTIVAYLIALAALLLATRVFLGFERRPVERPAKRWVMVADEQAAPATDSPKSSANPTFRLSPKGRTRQHSRMNSGDDGRSAATRSWWRTGARRPIVRSTRWPPTSWPCTRAPTGSNAMSG